MDKNKIIIVGGPTATGKTEYSIDIARAIGGEIVSADSMQLYKYMDIGSAKPTEEELSQVRHHLVDVVDPREPFSVAEYQAMAKSAIDDIFSRGLTPVISGGTGLYINSLIYQMDFGGAGCNPEFRSQMESIANDKGSEYLHQILSEKDPEAAGRIHPNNRIKLIRALETVNQTGRASKEFSESFIPVDDYDHIIIGLTRDRQELYDRINRRVIVLIERGLVEEVRRLQDIGLSKDDISMKGIGYKEVFEYIEGKLSLDEVIQLIQKNTRHYAKRQLTWLRRYKDIEWFNLSEYETKEIAMEDIISWLRSKL